MSFQGDTPILLSNYGHIDLKRLMTQRVLQRGVCLDRESEMLEFQSLVVVRRENTIKDAFRVTLQTGDSFVCSSDQKFIQEDNQILNLQDLQSGSRLRGIHTNQKNDPGYVVRSIQAAQRAIQLYAFSVVRYGNAALACGVFVKT